jgi:predicted extracellular nuclease
VSPRPRVPARVPTLALIGALAITLLPVADRPAQAFTQDPAHVWINEIHYDNTGTDADEAIEIAGPAGTALTGWTVVPYNGANGMSYTPTVSLSGTIPNEQNGFGTVVASIAGLQNGAPDGIALVNGTTVIQFLSYEGSFVAANGPAAGLASTDIGLDQEPAPAVGLTLALTGTGSTYQAFAWAADVAASFDSPNPGQTFVAVEAAPFIDTSTPADGATGVARNAALSITFNEPVTLDSGAVALSCNGNPIAISHAAGPATTFPITYLGMFPDGASCAITISATGVHDVDTADPPDTMAADASIDFTVVAADPCAGAFTPIPQIQGSGATPAITGPVITEGVVVGDFEGPAGTTLRGYYVQDAAGDANALTSDGIFVFNGPNTTAVNIGDSVRVSGSAADFQDQTQITQSAVVVCSTGATVMPTDIAFPVDSLADLERYEGMLVRVAQTMTVTEHFQLGRFGQVLLSSDGRLDQPTAVVEPGAPAAALQAANNLRKILVDDASQGQNPDPIVFGRDGQPLSASNTLRGGDTASGIVGVMTYTFGGNAASPNAFRIRPINSLGGQIEFEAVNDRPGGTAEVDGGTRVAALNLLNYFNSFSGCTNGVGGVATDCRGAENATEFARQVPKTVAAILGLDAAVVGVNEIENDGYGPSSSIAHLVAALNAGAGAGTYAFIDADAATGQVNALGDDAIKVGLIYRPADVTPVGDTAVLNTPEFVLGGDAVPTDPDLPKLRSRPSLAQAFETTDGARFIVDVNHFKSKGSPCDIPDAGDGQGNCNVVRTNGAHELVEWLDPVASDPTGTGDRDILIMGDLNSYAKEDPIDVLTGAGYTDLVQELAGDPYSFVFDGQWGYLDYALASDSARDQVAGVLEWHINSDEPNVLDYNTNFKSPGQLLSLYAPDRFRVSDHDPIVVGLDAATDRPSVDAGGPYVVEELGTVELVATGSDPTDDDLSFAWDLDGDGTFETDGATVTFAAGSLQAPQTLTVTVRVTDEHGQSAQDTATIDVIWDFGGFQSPSNPGGVTTINAGSSLPVKFSLHGAQGTGVLDGNPRFQRTDCTSGAPIGAPIVAASNTPFQYDAASDTYTFVWKTQKAWSGWCGTLSVALDDGQTYPLSVRFR